MPLASFLNRLEALGLSASGRAQLEIVQKKGRCYAPKELILRDNDPVDDVIIVEKGMVRCSKTVDRRLGMNTSLALPGEAFDVGTLITGKASYHAHAVADCWVIQSPRSEWLKLCETDNTLWQALWRLSVLQAEIGRQWLVNIGRRVSTHRIAFFLLELQTRLGAGPDFYLPLHQYDLAETLGMSLVHTNKSLKQLREWKLVAIKAGHVRVLDQPGLESLASFDPTYLNEIAYDRVRLPAITYAPSSSAADGLFK